MSDDEKDMEMDSGDEFDDDAVVVGQMPTISVPKHIKKRSLKNKALAVGFNDKDLRDFVTGFHKRKKKRRKEAQRQMEVKERLKRIQARKKRKQERELAQFGRVLTKEDHEGGDDGSEPVAGDLEEDEPDNAASVSETKTYDAGNTTITVLTCDLSCEDDDLKLPRMTKSIGTHEKSHNLAVKKKPMKQISKNKSKKRRKTVSKKDKHKGGGKLAAQKDKKQGRKGRR